MRVRLGAGELVVADLRDDDLDLERLQRAGELVADQLREEPGEGLAAHVLAAEAEALDVRPLDADLPEPVELAVLPDAGEPDAVVDLADLRSGRRGSRRRAAMPPSNSSVTRDLPRAIPLRANSALSWVICSGET